MSKSHAQQWTIVVAIERPPAAAVGALAEFSTTQIADCGGPVGVVGPGLGRIAGGAEFCGPAVTVWTRPGDILFMLKMPEVTQSGDVVAVHGGGRADAAILGDILAGAVARRGVVGIVVVPREHLDVVIASTREVAQRETAWRQALADGASVAAATGAEALVEERRKATAAPLP